VGRACIRIRSSRSQLARTGQCTHYERAPLRKQSARATHACGGFAPTPPGFGALVPLPIWSFTGQIAKGGRPSIPLYRSRPLSRRSGCFPAWPYPPLSSALIVLGRENRGCARLESMTLALRGSGPSKNQLPPRRYGRRPEQLHPICASSGIACCSPVFPDTRQRVFAPGGQVLAYCSAGWLVLDRPQNRANRTPRRTSTITHDLLCHATLSSSRSGSIGRRNGRIKSKLMANNSRGGEPA
jgi:hypothetical protein